MRWFGILALPVLCACAAPATEPPYVDPSDRSTMGLAPGVKMIEVSSASFSGSTSTRIYADGTVIGDTSAPGQKPEHNVQHVDPAAYARAAVVLGREGLKAKAAIKPQAQQCLDYGTDLVRAVPPVAGFEQATASCPDMAMSGLMTHVLAALAHP